MSRFTSEQVREAAIAYLVGINDEEITYTVEKCILWDGIVRISSGVLGYPDIPLSRSYSGIEGDLSQYDDTCTLEFIVEDIFAGGPSLQDTSLEECNEWVSELEG